MVVAMVINEKYYELIVEQVFTVLFLFCFTTGKGLEKSITQKIDCPTIWAAHFSAFVQFSILL